MRIVVREMRVEEARPFLEVIRPSVRGIAAKDYPQDVFEAWAPLAVTNSEIERFLANPENGIRLVAEIDSAIAGIGELIPGESELRACYVPPGLVRKGVGTAVIAEIERIARDHGITSFRFDSTITAEPFYRPSKRKTSGQAHRARRDLSYIQAQITGLRCTGVHNSVK